MENIKINKLEIENVKRVKAVKIEPTANGLTVIGGNNSQGKTSVLDAIAWALGGDRYRPSTPTREGSTIPPIIKLTLSNGLIVERKGKNSDLKVIDPTGKKAGQQLLNEFVEELALNLPKFLQATNKEKAQILLNVIGVGEQLSTIELKEQELYNQRTTIGRIADQKKKYADEQPFYIDAPKELISANELIKQQQEILAINGENQRKRENVAKIEYKFHVVNEEIARMKKQLHEKEEEFLQLAEDLETAKMNALDLLDQSTEELEKNIQQIDEINLKVRMNFAKSKAEEDAKQYKDEYDALTIQIEDLRKEKIELLNNADLPLPELSVDKGVLVYKGQQWDNMSSSEQLRVGTAIIRKLKPQCGFVLLDKLEQMDIPTMNSFGQWLESQGLQAIATRVSTGDECSIIIEDGYVVKDQLTAQAPKQWKAGEF